MNPLVQRKSRWAYIREADELSIQRVRSALDQQMDELYRAVNALADRVDVLESVNLLEDFTVSDYVTHTFTTVNTNETFNHGLGVVPVGLIQARLVATRNPGVVYFGSTAPTATQVTLRCTIAGAQAVILFA